MKTSFLVLAGVAWLALGWTAEQKPIAVAVGQEFKITLDSGRTKGCQWLLARPLDDKMVKSVGNDKPNVRVVGGKGVETLSFRAVGEGQTQIHLKYASLWEQNAAPTQQTNFVVVISKATTR